MAKGILYVETRPKSPDEAAGYHEWYDHTHLPELVAMDGVVSARRFAPIEEGDPFVAIYEIDADDVEVVRARIIEAMRSGALSKPVGIDPQSVFRFYRQITEYPS